ncbi:MAG: sugar phosphate nucleotidyltransferase [bacterium]
MYNSLKVSKAVIPAAGLGLRMQPMSRIVPKELLPVGRLPMLHYALSEAVAAGATEIFIIVDENKKPWLVDFYAGAEWKNLLLYQSESEYNRRLTNIEITFIEQKQMKGVYHAVTLSKKHIGSEPFLLLMPDNVYFGDSPISSALIKCFTEYKKNVIGLKEVKKQEAELFGNSGRITYRLLENGVYEILTLHDKSAGTFQTGNAECAIRACGRCVLGPDFFEEAEKISKERLQKHDEVPILQNLVRKKNMLGVLLKGQLFDCGHWKGYWAANQFWMQKNTTCS